MVLAIKNWTKYTPLNNATRYTYNFKHSISYNHKMQSILQENQITNMAY